MQGPTKKNTHLVLDLHWIEKESVTVADWHSMSQVKEGRKMVTAEKTWAYRIDQMLSKREKNRRLKVRKQIGIGENEKCTFKN